LLFILASYHPFNIYCCVDILKPLVQKSSPFKSLFLHISKYGTYFNILNVFLISVVVATCLTISSPFTWSYCHGTLTIDGVWIGNWIYWTLTDCDYITITSAITNSHTLQFTTARTKSSQSAVSSPVVAWWRIEQYPLLPFPPYYRLATALQLTHSKSKSKSKLLYDWRFTANQFALAPSPLRITTRIFFLQLNPCGRNPYVTPSLTRGWVCLLWIHFASPLSSVHISHIVYYWKFFLVHYIYKSSVSPGFSKQIMPLVLILCYNGRLVTWTVVSLTTAKFKPITFSTSGFALSYADTMFILMILYDFCLLPAQFCCTIVYIRKVKSRVQIADRCAPCKFSRGAQNLV
jgi:hypothetical protein